MTILNGLFLIVVGLGVMGFGLMLFYALLPLFYGFFGAGVGFWLGTLVTGTAPEQMSWIKLLFALGGVIVFAGGAYFFEPFRRILIGIGLGSLLGGLIASALGLTGFFGVVIMVVAAFIGAGITLAMFDTFIVVCSAFGGAGLAMDGGHLMFQSMNFLDRTTIAGGAYTPLVIWAVLGAIAMGWQFMNIARWTSKARPTTG